MRLAALLCPFIYHAWRVQVGNGRRWAECTRCGKIGWTVNDG
jgi:hypothetical protein